MLEYFCYTTVFNAIELFSICATSKEKIVVEDVMYSMKILGLNGKSAKNIGAFFRQSHTGKLSSMEVLVAGLCLESRLPLLTGEPRRYRDFRSLHVISPKEVIASSKKGTVWS
jgi:predicted nucleic acid-binding protein